MIKWHVLAPVQCDVHVVAIVSDVQALAAFFIYLERRKGIRTSGYLLIFWLLLLVTSILIFQSKIRAAVTEVSSGTEKHINCGVHSILMWILSGFVCLFVFLFISKVMTWVILQCFKLYSVPCLWLKCGFLVQFQRINKYFCCQGSFSVHSDTTSLGCLFTNIYQFCQTPFITWC